MPFLVLVLAPICTYMHMHMHMHMHMQAYKETREDMRKWTVQVKANREKETLSMSEQLPPRINLSHASLGSVHKCIKYYRAACQ